MKLRLIFVFILYTQLCFSQSLLKKRLDFSAQQLSVNDALLKLETAANIRLSFSSSFFNKSQQKVSVNLTQATVKEILAHILKHQEINFKVLNNTVILYKSKPKYATISGYIEDEDTGERLIAATVYSPILEGGVISNEYGFYSVRLPVGDVELQFNYLGVCKKTMLFKLASDIHQNVTLKTTVALKEVVVKPESEALALISSSKREGTQLLTELVSASPNLGGEEDYVRTAQLLPGVNSGIDGLGGLQVRGGDVGHHLMMLDGVPVYMPYHLLGVYSIYNASTIQSAKLFKGMVPARYGGRLTSYFDIRTREGNKHEWLAEAGVNMINSKLLIEGPIRKPKGEKSASFLIAGRYSPFVTLLSPVFDRTFFNNIDGQLYSEFYDANLKLNYNFSNKDRIYLSIFNGHDTFTKYFREDNIIATNESIVADNYLDYNWGNSIASLRWNHLFNNRLFVNTTLTYSFYEFAFSNLESFLEVEEEDGALEEELEELYFIDNRSENQDIGLRIDIDYVPAPKHTIRMGLEASVKSFSPVLTFLDSDSEEIIDRLDEDLAIDDLDDYAISTTSEVAELDVYIEDQIDLNANWQLDLGLRASSFLNAGTEKSYFNLEPRILLNHTLSTKLQVHASANRLVQYLHLVSNSALKLPNDLWIPASADMLPQQSWQFELGAAIHISSALHFNVDAYYLNIQNLYRYPDDFSFLDIVNDSRPEDFLLRGDGQNYGIETLLKYDGDNRGFMLSYTLSKAERQYDSLNLGMPFPYDLDHRHRLKLFFFQKLGEHFQIGLNWIYSSATPRLNLVDTQLGQGFIRTDLNPSGRKNELRASPYYRFDLNVSYHRIGKKLEHRLVLGTYNTFDRRNIAYYQVNANSTTHPVGFMPIVPSISYTLNY